MKSYQPWGKLASLDLYDCNHSTMVDAEGLKTFIAELIVAVGMVAHGPCYIDRFGNGKLLGYSAMQFIETSSVTVHLDEVDNRAFIDVFSCKQFSAKKAVSLSKKYFGTSQYKLREMVR